MKIVIACDHGGLLLKKALIPLIEKAGHTVVDIGATSDEMSDYPDWAHDVAKKVLSKEHDRGILICGTGVGMAISANRHAGIRAVNCSDTFTARLSRQHNDANVLCIGERVMGPGLGWEIVKTWLDEPTSNDERHVRRRSKIEL